MEEISSLLILFLDKDRLSMSVQQEVGRMFQSLQVQDLGWKYDLCFGRISLNVLITVLIMSLE